MSYKTSVFANKKKAVVVVLVLLSKKSKKLDEKSSMENMRGNFVETSPEKYGEKEKTPNAAGLVGFF